MNVLFNGFDSQEATFKASSTVLTKRAVALQSTGDVAYAEPGGAFTGIVTGYRNGLASVVMRGWAEVNYRNTAPSVGICKLSVSSMGQLEIDEANGKPYTVVGVDTASKTIEIIL